MKIILAVAYESCASDVLSLTKLNNCDKIMSLFFFFKKRIMSLILLKVEKKKKKKKKKKMICYQFYGTSS